MNTSAQETHASKAEVPRSTPYETTRGDFTLPEPGELYSQNDLAPFFEHFLPGFAPDMLDTTHVAYAGQHGKGRTAPEMMALSSCAPVALWTYLRMSRAGSTIGLGDFIEKMWPAFNKVNGTWTRSIMTRTIHEEFHTPLVSAARPYLDKPIGRDDEVRMLESGYCNDQDDMRFYEESMHGKSIEDILSVAPCVVTIAVREGESGPHAVVGWQIVDGVFYFYNPDAREERDAHGMCSRPISALYSDTARKGGVTVLRPVS
jgi:hypothetical protein